MKSCLNDKCGEERKSKEEDTQDLGQTKKRKNKYLEIIAEMKNKAKTMTLEELIEEERINKEKDEKVEEEEEEEENTMLERIKERVKIRLKKEKEIDEYFDECIKRHENYIIETEHFIISVEAKRVIERGGRYQKRGPYERIG